MSRGMFSFRCCRYSFRICATSAMEGQRTMDTSPDGVSSSTIRSEMRVLPVPHGRMILPRASPFGEPPLFESAWSRRRRTLAEIASRCIQDFA